ncbi:Hypothetical_protein [Hexamita inflata]|uniref:Hypothetical_protein n=1 Tax=Hexamita inflata TaxID=28002 RepID=A0AA86USR8_9EUKA|nr:Hypothetical protein HINF_LOCUS57900 [Hexamita inflata]
MLLNLLYNGNLCKLDQGTRNLIKFSENFWKRCLQLKWKTKSDTRNIPNWDRFALTYRHPGHFWKLLGCLYSNKGGWFNSRLCSIQSIQITPQNHFKANRIFINTVSYRQK